MSKIFISYRRDDSADIAGRIYDYLTPPLGPFQHEDVFKDVDSIPFGVNFKKHLENMVNQCAVCLVVIGPHWLDAADSSGHRRLDDPRDFVRIEVETALNRNIPVIPLLVMGASMPGEDRLPSGLTELVYRNGTPVRRDPDFKADIGRLIKSLEQWLPGSAVPQPTPQIITPDKPAFTLPMLEWCDIPAGNVTVESGVWTMQYGMKPGRGRPENRIGKHVYRVLDKRNHLVETFRISKYPITNAQFKVFVDARDGYVNEAWWDFSRDASEWRQKNPNPEIRAFDGNTRPREMVCWYEAMAFCRWLSHETGLSITLPTEPQWQRAAQGDDNRIYPWGNEFESHRCNTSESGKKETTPVDRYSDGCSPYGVYDMAGNVSEWCINEESPSNPWNRVLRGGSWEKSQDYAQVTQRSSSSSTSRFRSGGFRVVSLPG